MNRRQFLQGAAVLSTAGMWVRFSAYANEPGPTPGTANRLLLVVFLQGGNDALNTVAPVSDPAYARARPVLGLRANQGLALGQGSVLHPSLPWLHQQWTGGRLAIVDGVGYLGSDQSHSRSTDTWETASPERRWTTGWIGRYLDRTEHRRFGPVRAAALTVEPPRTLVGATSSPVATESLASFSFADRGAADEAERRTAFAEMLMTSADDVRLRTAVAAGQRRMIDAVNPVASATAAAGNVGAGAGVAHLFASGVGTEIGFIRLTGFDTHSDQPLYHGKRLASLDDTLREFFATATNLGVADRATALVVSEFGRRVGENAGVGTDHGAAGTAFVVGPRVRGGYYGPRPSLTDLQDGSLKPTVDFRSVYASMLEQVLGVRSRAVLGGTYAPLPLVNL